MKQSCNKYTPKRILTVNFQSAWKMRQTVLRCQEAFSAMERCPKPVIVCVHSAAIGGAIDLMCCADIRLCSKDAWFRQVGLIFSLAMTLMGFLISIKEVDVGLAADVGTLQRLHQVVGNNSIARELCYTARRMKSDEAERIGFVSRVHEDRDEMLSAGLAMAKEIATKSPVAIAGTKINLNYSREHTVKDSLDYVATWNASMLQTEDVMKSAMAGMTKSPLPEFSKL